MKLNSKNILLLILFIQFSIYINAQDIDHTAPTLQVGLDGLSLGKGMLDSELILEIISEKQSEIKLRIAQNILLQPLNECGGTIYAFGDNILSAVIEEKDPIIRKRKVIESLVNTLFSISYKEYFENKIISNSKKYEREFNSYRILQSLIFDQEIIDKISFDDEVKNLKNKTYFSKEKEIKTNRSILFETLILDISTEAIRNTRQFDELGIFKVNYSNMYNFQSHYKNPNFESKKMFGTQFNYINPDTIRKHGNILFRSMRSDLNNLSKLIGYLNLIISSGTFRSNDSNLEATIINRIGENYIQANFIPSINLIDSIIINSKDLTNTQFKYLTEIRNYIKKADIFLSKNPSGDTYGSISDIIYTLEKEFIPNLSEIGVNNEKTIELISNLIEQSENLSSKLKDSIDIQELFNNKENNKELFLFIKLLANLYEFDKSATYIDYINYSFKITESFLKGEYVSTKVAESIDYFSSFVNDYVIISTKEEEVIEFKVESFLAKLSRMKMNQASRFRLVFDVGASVGKFNSDFTIETSPVSNLSFIGEKIGVKYIISDKQFWKKKNPGDTYQYFGKEYVKLSPPSEPIISNYYAILYGTGILYNLFNTSTQNSFDSPFIGTGLGIGFFNNLDLSFTAAIPIQSNKSIRDSFKYTLWSINFDIRFNEYFQRLGEKRKASQNRKALAQAESKK